MGTIQSRVFRCRGGRLAISLVFLWISGFTHDVSVAQGRQIARNPVDVVVKGTDPINGDGEATERSLIGSRPPRCQLKCRRCGHCEAIQVPVAPKQKLKLEPDGGGSSHSASDLTPTTEYARGDDRTNYKPVSWRCKCGDLIFDP